MSIWCKATLFVQHLFPIQKKLFVKPWLWQKPLSGINPFANPISFESVICQLLINEEFFPSWLRRNIKKQWMRFTVVFEQNNGKFPLNFQHGLPRLLVKIIRKIFNEIRLCNWSPCIVHRQKRFVDFLRWETNMADIRKFWLRLRRVRI